MIDTQFRNQPVTYSNLWFIFSIVVAIITFILTFVYYDRIPNEIPLNYSLSCEVTNWAHKSYKTVFIFPATQLFIIVLFIFINMIIQKAKQQISIENPEDSRLKNIIFRKRWSGFIVITGISMTFLFAVIQLSFIFDFNEKVLVGATTVFIIAILIGAIALSLATGQGGSRVETNTNYDENIIDRDEDRYWKLGVFYVNKNDPSIF